MRGYDGIESRSGVDVLSCILAEPLKLEIDLSIPSRDKSCPHVVVHGVCAWIFTRILGASASDARLSSTLVYLLAICGCALEKLWLNREASAQPICFLSICLYTSMDTHISEQVNARIVCTWEDTQRQHTPFLGRSTFELSVKTRPPLCPD